jgi:hypothetical protein
MGITRRSLFTMLVPAPVLLLAGSRTSSSSAATSRSASATPARTRSSMSGSSFPEDSSSTATSMPAGARPIVWWSELTDTRMSKRS